MAITDFKNKTSFERMIELVKTPLDSYELFLYSFSDLTEEQKRIYFDNLISVFPKDKKYLKDALLFSSNYAVKEVVLDKDKWVNDKVDEFSKIIEYIEKKQSIKEQTQKEEKLLKQLRIHPILDEEEIIDTIYKYLYPNYITISKDEFSKHFQSKDSYQKIKWLGIEPEIKFLFDELCSHIKPILINTTVNQLITDHFITKTNKPFKPKQLSTVTERSAYRRLKDRDETNHPLLQLIKSLNNRLS